MAKPTMKLLRYFSARFGPRTRCWKEEKRRVRHVCSVQDKKSTDATGTPCYQPCNCKWRIQIGWEAMLSHPQLFFKETSQCCSEDHNPLSFVIMKFIYCMSTTVENIEICFLHEIVLYIPSIKYKFFCSVRSTWDFLCVKPVTTCWGKV